MKPCAATLLLGSVIALAAADWFAREPWRNASAASDSSGVASRRGERDATVAARSSPQLEADWPGNAGNMGEILDEWDRLQSDPNGRLATMAFLQRVAGCDPLLAGELALDGQATDSPRLHQVLSALLDAPLAKGDFEAARGWVERFHDPDLRLLLAVKVGRAWARGQPEAALAWAWSAPTEEARLRIAAEIASAWGEKEPLEAARFFLAFPPGMLRRELLAGVARIWTAQDSASAGEYFGQAAGEPDIDPALAGLSFAALGQAGGRERALAFAEGISGFRERTDAIVAVVQQWAREDPAAAARYVEQSPLLTSGQRAGILSLWQAEGRNGQVLRE